jgi:plasmid stabilization system protein ParE
MKLRYTERAITDLEAIQAYIAPHNPRASVAVGARIRGAIELHADFPWLGRTEPATTRCACCR